MTSTTRRLRIGFVSIKDALDVSSWSGIPYHVLMHLREHPVDIELFSPLDRRLKWLQAPQIIMAKLRRQRLVLNHVPMLLKSYARQIECQLRSRSVDVVLSVDSIPITYLQCKQPVVFWNDAVFHDMVDYYPGFFSSLSPAAVRRGKREEERALQRCDIAVYSSNWAANRARRLTDPTKVKIVPFGSCLIENASEEEIICRARAKRTDRPNACELLFVGVEWDRKGGDLAIETTRLLNEAGIKARLRAVGSRPPYAVPDYVELLGRIPKSTPGGLAQLSSLFRDSDVFILPTKAEASAIVFCEASSFGLPIVTYDTGGTVEYVKDGISGACLPVTANAADFAAAIGVFLEPTRYECLSRGAHQQYRDRLNWKTSVTQLVSILNQSTSGMA